MKRAKPYRSCLTTDKLSFKESEIKCGLEINSTSSTYMNYDGLKGNTRINEDKITIKA